MSISALCRWRIGPDGRTPTASLENVLAYAVYMHICGEVRLLIHHNLMANCEQQEIRLKSTANRKGFQCRNWLSKNVPQALLKEYPARSDARLAQMEPGMPPRFSAKPASCPPVTAASSSRKSRICRTTRRGSLSSVIRRAARPATTRRPSCSAWPTTPGLCWAGPGHLQAEQNQPGPGSNCTARATPNYE